mmetsp:Transcript_34252/g.134215  ORF Transcript_34252/g.134215 Transcript_34252/m.134215 type:complete len:143 (-) Transcript_34252:5968-6396(-)
MGDGLETIDTQNEEDEDDVFDMSENAAFYSIDRMADILLYAEDQDKEFILGELQQLLGHCPDDFENILLPVICNQCVQWSTDLQFKSAQVRGSIPHRRLRRQEGIRASGLLEHIRSFVKGGIDLINCLVHPASFEARPLSGP